MSRISTRPSRSSVLSRFHSSSSLGVVALLVSLLFAAGPAAAQVAARSGEGEAPKVPVSTVDGFVTSVNGSVVTLLGSRLLELDLAGAIITPMDADATDATPPPVSPGAYIVALVEASGAIITVYPPPPLKVIKAAVRPADTARLVGEVQGVGTDSFTLLFRTILVDAATVFRGPGSSGPVHGLSDLKPGMQVAAWVKAEGDALKAVRVVALNAAVNPKTIQFQGVVKSIGADSWTIGDFTVGVTSETKIVGDPKLGNTVDVIAKVVDPPRPMMAMPSRLVAVSIVKVVLPPPPVVPGRTTSFTGPVQAMPTTGTLGFWKIADRVVTVTGLTTVSGSPVVGSEVTVTGYYVPGPMPGLGMATPSAMPFIATEIKTLP